MYLSKLHDDLVARVLIDTWWNVNINNYDSHRKSTMVLIDTWWNVNERIGKIRGKFAGFNRYMVECESGWL